MSGFGVYRTPDAWSARREAEHARLATGAAFHARQNRLTRELVARRWAAQPGDVALLDGREVLVVGLHAQYPEALVYILSPGARCPGEADTGDLRATGRGGEVPAEFVGWIDAVSRARGVS